MAVEIDVVAASLKAGLVQLGLEVSPDRVEQLISYVRLLVKWNRVYNLSAVRDPGEIVVTHILDSLSVLPFLPSGSLVDVGSGGGFPGIPIAIVEPGRAVTLVEDSQKKSAFQMQVKIELGLGNVSVVNRRVETFTPQPAFDLVISRAFSSIFDFARLAGHLCSRDGRLFAMKGSFPASEIAGLQKMFHVERVIPLEVPGLNSERHLIIVAPQEV